MKIIRYWLPIVFLLLGIYLFSSTPKHELEAIEFLGSHLIGHIAEYFILGFLVCRALTFKIRTSPSKLTFEKFRKPVAIAALVVLIYAILDEWHQSFVPGRNSQVKDVFLDLASGIPGALFTFYYRKWVRAKVLHGKIHHT